MSLNRIVQQSLDIQHNLQEVGRRADVPVVFIWDSHTGGTVKVPPFDRVYIELPADTPVGWVDGMDELWSHRHNLAIKWWEQVTAVDMNGSSCRCCGPDFSFSSNTLRQATATHRRCAYSNETHMYTEDPEIEGLPSIPLDQWLKRPHVLFIPLDVSKIDFTYNSKTPVYHTP